MAEFRNAGSRETAKIEAQMIKCTPPFPMKRILIIFVIAVAALAVSILAIRLIGIVNGSNIKADVAEPIQPNTPPTDISMHQQAKSNSATAMSEQNDQSEVMDKTDLTKLADNKYIAILARNTIGDSLHIPENTETQIVREQGVIIVQFIYPLSEGARGPDFYAEVTISSSTGQILKILSGS